MKNRRHLCCFLLAYSILNDDIRLLSKKKKKKKRETIKGINNLGTMIFDVGVPFRRTLDMKKYETRGKLSGILANKINKSNYIISLSSKFYSKI